MRRRAMLLMVVMGAAVMLSSGVALAVTKQCADKEGHALNRCVGTEGADTLRGTTYHDSIYGRGGNDTLVGYSGRDSLDGEDGRDTLLGGKNPDVLNGGRGNDTLDGGQGGDAYYFGGEGWGKDRITDTLEPGSDMFDDNIVSFDSGPSEGLIINLASDSGSTPEVSSKSDNSTVNWDGDIVDDVRDGSGDDTISGNSATNHIYADSGDDDSSDTDTISAGDGDDVIYVDDGAGGDTVECGEGNDTVYRDPPDPATGDPGDTISSDCEIQLDPH